MERKCLNGLVSGGGGEAFNPDIQKKGNFGLNQYSFASSFNDIVWFLCQKFNYYLIFVRQIAGIKTALPPTPPHCERLGQVPA